MNSLDKAQAELARDLRAPSATPITDAELWEAERDSGIGDALPPSEYVRKLEADRAALVAALEAVLIERLGRAWRKVDLDRDTEGYRVLDDARATLARIGAA